MTESKAAARWRLLLGHYAEQQLARQLSPQQQQQDRALQYLYGREYQQRGLKQHRVGGTLDASQLKALDWLSQTAQLFPQAVFEQIRTDALTTYGMAELLNDPAVLSSIEPNPALTRSLLAMRGRLSAAMMDAVRSIIRRTVEEIQQRLKPRLTQAISGQRQRFRRGFTPSMPNFDWRKTIARNLRHYDPSRQRLVIERPYFNSRVQRKLDWDLILLVDQSASMMDSVIYAAVLAGILAGLPNIHVRLLVFDTQVVDLTSVAHDPVEVLMTVQLGGGTLIGQALQKAETLVRRPTQTIVTLISDFEEGGPAGPMLAAVRRLAEQRVTLLGLAALDQQAQPVYDYAMAQRLVQAGMPVAALTPEHFADWLGQVLHGGAG